jgi:tRNA threonylcarbamoyladenosine biosynthesis protein TsaE
MGELGAGKTAFVRGIAEGAEVSPREVASPTFAIVYPYRGRISVFHADLYRLADEDELYATGLIELVTGEQGASIVEWIDRIPSLLPPDRLVVRLSPDEKEPTVRHIAPSAQGARSVPLLQAWLPGDSIK